MAPEFVAVVPVKPPARGKSRLGLTDRDRSDLARAFALDTIAACRASARVDRVLVVTDDAVFASTPALHDCLTLPDGVSGDLNATLVQAVAEAHRRWPELMPVALCADLPALAPGDLDAALGSLVPGGPSFVADTEGIGTTLYTASHDEFAPLFGSDSARAHLGAGALEIRSVGGSLRRDVDDLGDLHEAVSLGVGAETAAALVRLEVG